MRAAGASYCMDEIEIVRNIENAGFVAKRRNMHYEMLGDPIFRERDVPRMLDAGDGARGRRHVGARGAEAVSGAERHGKERASHGRRRPAGQPVTAGPRHASRSARDWVLPSTRGPCIGGWIAVDDGRIGGLRRRCGPERDTISGPSALLPGLVNAHTHLELSYLRGRVAAAASIHRLGSRAAGARATARRHRDADASARRDAALARLARRARRWSATSPTHSSRCDALADSGHAGRRLPRAARVQRSRPGSASCGRAQAADAPSRRASACVRCAWRRMRRTPCRRPCSRAIRADLDAARIRVLSVHLGGVAGGGASSSRTAAGPWRDAARGARRVEPGVAARLACGPVEYLDRLGFLDARAARRARRAVHGRGSRRDCARAARPSSPVRAATSWSGAARRRSSASTPSGVRVAIGTDSLASVDDLNLFDELAEVRRLAPRVPAARAARERDAGRGAGRSDSATSSGRSSQASARRSSRSACRTASTMWKNIWSVASPPTDVSWLRRH